MIITRLGAGVDATGLLDPEALARTETVLARYCRRARALGRRADPRRARRARCATPTNREVFAAMVRRHAGTDPEVIDGDEEAALSFLGGTRGLPAADGPFLLRRHRRRIDGVRGRARSPGRAERTSARRSGRSA